ncbi:hypothetical protein RB653_000996 [Dictyostelium firmibasis]|uniref:Uncharacterized protein n=1 Tax=Dictyostelium firmibasis TaxID=79012 RepID=A0AAN7YR40_9MYCE
MSDTKYSKYISNQYGFELEYPEKWIVKEHSAMYLASFMESKEESAPNINITIQNLEGSIGPDQVMTPKQLLDISIQQIEQINATNIETGSCKIGSNNADFLSYYAPEQKVRNKQCFFIKNNNVFIISYTSSNGNFTKHLPVLEHCCQTFKNFEAKGYKYTQMEAFTSNIKSSTKTIFYQYWVPKNWKSSKPKSKEGKHQFQEYTDSSNNLSLKVEVQQKAAAAAETTNQGKKSNSTTNNKHHFNYDVWVEDVHLSLSFSCLESDVVSWEPLFDRFIADLKIDSSILESPVYDRFYNLIFQYYVHIPQSFAMDPRSSSFSSLIFIDQDFPMYPVFNITLEDLGVPIPLEKYRDILLSFYKSSVENARITNEESARIDNYRALRISMDGRDPEIDKNCKVIIQCAVVKRTKGLLLNVRLPTTIFESAYKKYFYMFHSLVFYNKNN